MKKQEIEGAYEFKHPYPLGDKRFIDRLQYDSIYLNRRAFLVDSQRERRLIKVVGENKSTIRKIRRYTKLKKNEITFDTITLNELGLRGNPSNILVKLKKVGRIEKYTKYYWKHPTEEIRFAYKLFLFGMIVAIVSAAFTIMGYFGI